LLVGGKKFDLRLYVLATSYKPLTVYLYREGFARFTTQRYDENDIENSEVHLTNVAVQKHSSEYNKDNGGKWDLRTLKNYLISKYGFDTVHNSFFDIQKLILKTLKCMSKIMSPERNCFELYGFDILIDDSFRPWLIEVNGSPSMRANTSEDKKLKIGIIDDVLTIADFE
jgi:tubulin polyglutamylase TTLL9